MERSSLLPVDEVIRELLARARPIDDVVEATIDACVGRVLAEDVVSMVDVPPADNSSMDGYALYADDPAFVEGGEYPVSGRIAAGYVGDPVPAGTVARIFTGAPIPAGANAVLMQEETEAAGDRVRLNRVPRRHENIRPRGQDIALGATVLERGTRIRPQEAALMASVGTARLKVFRPLRIAILSTGDELVEPPGPAGPGQIFNSNHYALIGLVRDLGMEVLDLGLVPDTAEATEAALRQATRGADCIVSSGGVSVGEEDHVKNALERLGKLEFWRIAIKPGKPLAFGEIEGVPFFGLPGNPVSTFVTFTMIARPYLLKYQGCRDILPLAIYASARFEMPAGSRREYVRVRLESDDDGNVTVSAFGNQGSGVMSSVSWANALAEVDVGQAVKSGDLLKVYLLQD
jgi:molybdopterin molybdotransferase